MNNEYWNGDAGEKWAAAQPLLDVILQPFADALLDAAAIPPTGIVVDVGCGCGATTVMATQRAPDVVAIGIDVSKPMLEVARRRVTDALRIRFEQADAADAAQPTPDGVDRIISRFGVMFFGDPLAAFTNMRGWLKSDGRFVAAVWGPLANNRWLTDLVEIVEQRADVAPLDPDGPGPFSLSDPTRVDSMLRAAGFGAVEQSPLDIPMRVPGSPKDVVNFCSQRGPIAATLQELEPARQAAVLDDIRQYVDERYDGSGASLEAQARLVHADASARQ